MNQNHFFTVLTLFVAILAFIYKGYKNDISTTPVSLTVVDEVEQVTTDGPTTTVTIFSNEVVELEMDETVVPEEIVEEMVVDPTEIIEVKPESEPLPALPVYNKASLVKYDGEDPSLPIYIALEGLVYDVTEGKKFYAPGGTYHFLAGTDGTFLLKTFGGDLIKQKYPVVGTFQD